MTCRWGHTSAKMVIDTEDIDVPTKVVGMKFEEDRLYGVSSTSARGEPLNPIQMIEFKLPSSRFVPTSRRRASAPLRHPNVR